MNRIISHTRGRGCRPAKPDHRTGHGTQHAHTSAFRLPYRRADLRRLPAVEPHRPPADARHPGRPLRQPRRGRQLPPAPRGAPTRPDWHDLPLGNLSQTCAGYTRAGQTHRTAKRRNACVHRGQLGCTQPRQAQNREQALPRRRPGPRLGGLLRRSARERGTALRRLAGGRAYPSRLLPVALSATNHPICAPACLNAGCAARPTPPGSASAGPGFSLQRAPKHATNHTHRVWKHSHAKLHQRHKHRFEGQPHAATPFPRAVCGDRRPGPRHRTCKLFGELHRNGTRCMGRNPGLLWSDSLLGVGLANRPNLLRGTGLAFLSDVVLHAIHRSLLRTHPRDNGRFGPSRGQPALPDRRAAGHHHHSSRGLHAHTARTTAPTQHGTLEGVRGHGQHRGGGKHRTAGIGLHLARFPVVRVAQPGREPGRYIVHHRLHQSRAGGRGLKGLERQTQHLNSAPKPKATKPLA